MSKIKAVIFDLDGTIANTLPLCIQAFRKSVEPLINRSLSDEEIIATFGPSEEGTIKILAPHNYNEGVKSYLHFYEKLHGMCPVAFAGVEEILSTLKQKGVHISMVTGKGNYSTEISLKQFKLNHFFEIIETGAPTGPRKVDGIKIVLEALSSLNKEEIIYVGDAPSDIEASRSVGISVIAAAWAETAEPEKLIPLKPDELFYTIEDFKGWLYSRI
ncbi:HAD family hydrolase [Pedobacter aquatilis]|uniref:HAD family hydrolase n=1 Tax=Pedobacter aquatilis TaxID=351343 RepID=UPI002930FA8F|nr:HAD family hydrolase [Pedobacter aquatilis]